MHNTSTVSDILVQNAVQDPKVLDPIYSNKATNRMSLLDHLCLVNASVFQTLHLCLKGSLSLKICSLPAKKTMTTSSVVFFLL